ncbi:MAG: hypothetical protein AVDCRST_MAG45-169, partial [uncultured Solirubrobacterales bacterium]
DAREAEEGSGSGRAYGRLAQPPPGRADDRARAGRAAPSPAVVRHGGLRAGGRRRRCSRRPAQGVGQPQGREHRGLLVLPRYRLLRGAQAGSPRRRAARRHRSPPQRPLLGSREAGPRLRGRAQPQSCEGRRRAHGRPTRRVLRARAGRAHLHRGLGELPRPVELRAGNRGDGLHPREPARSGGDDGGGGL